MTPERWRHVTRVYGAVMTKPPEARPAALLELCPDDEGLRKEVESLLADESGPAVLDRPFSEVASSLVDQNLSGRTLGPYRLESAIGAGGMGQVYRANDTRLHRTVALKVLAPSLAHDSQFRARFDREAKAIAALNHPHICTLHDIGSADGVEYLVMEYVEGETLSTRLEHGALPFDQALTCAIQIADALAAAHREGIVHRDLKPGNVMLTKSGIKLLDFGLARLRGDAASAGQAGSLSMLPTTPPIGPTRGTPLTVQGTILGTLQYMAPEQLEGKEADARTDIFAFGAITYEMLTGKKTFSGGSQASLIGAIMHADPPSITTLQPLTPASLERLVRTCLAKDPDQRWQSAADVARELTWVRSASTDVKAEKAAPTSRALRMLAIALTLLGGAALGFGIALSRSLARDDAVTRFVIDMPASHYLFTGGGGRPVLSPDGKTLFYPGVPTNGGRILYRRPFDQLDAKPIPGTENAGQPSFSPDGRYLTFNSIGDIKKLDLASGSVTTVLNCPGGCRGSTWLGSDTIIAAQIRAGAPLLRVPVVGGLATPIGTDRTDSALWYPQVLPGGHSVIATAMPPNGPTSAKVVVVSLDTGERQSILDGTGAQFIPTGHLVFSRGDRLFAVPFDPDRRQVIGTPVQVVETVQTNTGGLALFAFSSNGTLAYVPGGSGTTRSLVWVDRSGREEPIAGSPDRSYVAAAVSPDGTRIALDTRDQQNHIYIWNLAQRQMIPLTTNSAVDAFPVWSRDGKTIAFASARGSAMNLYLQDVDTTAPAGRLTESANPQTPLAFSSDGKQLIYVEDTADGGSMLGRVALSGDKQPGTIAQWSQRIGSSALSPDGSWIAYDSTVVGQAQAEVFVQSLRTGERHQISTNGGFRPAWARSGTEVFYQGVDERLMTVTIQLQPSFKATEAKGLLAARYYSAGPARPYEPSADGNRFLMMREGGSAQRATHIVVVQNWFEELERLAPLKN
jgi:eukaryotic-like serine/threonine-protein kinase